MNITGIILATVIVGAVGLLIGLLLGVVGQVFSVEVDEKEVAVRACLPGNNCGACGYPGCDGLASAICSGEAAIDQCPVGGAKVAAEIAKVMGVEAEAVVEEKEKNKAFVYCKGDNDTAVLNDKGRKICKFGCIACKICEKNCSFDAIHVVNGLAEVDYEKCVACGVCVTKCPKKIIGLLPESQLDKAIACSNKDTDVEPKEICMAYQPNNGPADI